MILTLEDLLARLGPVAYPTLREEYTPDCCIAAAAILLRVFEHYGYKAQVVPVTVQVYNAAMIKLLKGNTRLPEDPLRRELLFEVTGAWGVGIVPASAVLSYLRNRTEGGYGGHLLLRVEQYLVDATIAQVNRPDKQMVMPQLLVSPYAADLLREGSLAIEANECTVVYRLSSDESYQTAIDWKRRVSPVPETLKRILYRVEKEKDL